MCETEGAPLTAASAPPNGGDIVSAAVRSRMMSAVKQKDTRPELAVRQLLRGLGVHYRVQNRDLPGSPDIANRSKGWAIFVNGCFWHGHKNCSRLRSGRRSRVPVQHQPYWAEKLQANRVRDARKCRDLRRLGLRVLIVWECELRDAKSLSSRLSSFLDRAAIAPRRNR